MATMKAGLYDGKKMRLLEVPSPGLGPGDVIARVRCTGVCGSDLLFYSRNTTPDEIHVGHEVAGEVLAVGEGVDLSLIGRRVAIENIGQGRACGRCWFCRSGQFVQCTDLDPPRGGGYAELIGRRAAGCYPIPDSMSWEAAGLVEPLAVSVHGVRRGQMAGGETVLVLGAGNIGLTAVAAARAMGAGKVLVTARHPQQAKMAMRLGADEALPSEADDLAERVEAATDGRGADLTLESVGGYAGTTLDQAIRLTRTQGRIVILGGFMEPVTIDLIPPLEKEQSIIFSSCYSLLDGKHDYEIAIDQLASGRVFLDPMVTHRFPLERIGEAFETAYDKTSGSVKVQIHQLAD